MPKVSVLMPIYNTQEEHLREAIESILAQSYTDFEFLILNDSPDNTSLESIVASYNDSRIQYSVNEKNLGITPSRNKLIDMAQGEYLAVMDHDDISMPERFAKQVAFLDEHADVGVVGTWKVRINGKKDANNVIEHSAIEEELMLSCCLMHPTVMLRKTVLIETGVRYEESFSPAEDYALFCRLIGKTRFANIPEILFVYRNHADNTSHKQRQKMYDADLRIKAFVRHDNPLLWKTVSACLIKSKKIKVFGLPFLHIHTEANITKCYLWNTILLYSVKTTIQRN